MKWDGLWEGEGRGASSDGDEYHIDKIPLLLWLVGWLVMSSYRTRYNTSSPPPPPPSGHELVPPLDQQQQLHASGADAAAAAPCWSVASLSDDGRCLGGRRLPHHGGPRGLGRGQGSCHPGLPPATSCAAPSQENSPTVSRAYGGGRNGRAVMMRGELHTGAAGREGRLWALTWGRG